MPIKDSKLMCWAFLLFGKSLPCIFGLPLMPESLISIVPEISVRMRKEVRSAALNSTTKGILDLV